MFTYALSLKVLAAHFSWKERSRLWSLQSAHSFSLPKGKSHHWLPATRRWDPPARGHLPSLLGWLGLWAGLPGPLREGHSKLAHSIEERGAFPFSPPSPKAGTSKEGMIKGGILWWNPSLGRKQTSEGWGWAGSLRNDAALTSSLRSLPPVNTCSSAQGHLARTVHPRAGTAEVLES